MITFKDPNLTAEYANSVAERNWKKLGRAEVFSAESRQMEKNLQPTYVPDGTTECVIVIILALNFLLDIHGGKTRIPHFIMLKLWASGR